MTRKPFQAKFSGPADVCHVAQGANPACSRHLRKKPGISTLRTDECHEKEIPWLSDMMAEGQQLRWAR